MTVPSGPDSTPAIRPRIRAAARLRRLREDRALVMLGNLLILGIALRASLTLQWRPAFVGYSDSGIYFQDVQAGTFSDPIRTVGYGMMLSALHAISPHLVLVALVQHVLGLWTAVLLFATLRRISAPPWVALAPAAVVLFGGTQLFLEHAALSEALFTWLLAVMLYAAVRAPGGALRWAATAGACAGLSIWVRGTGVILVPVLVAWLLVASPKPRREELTAAGLALASALLVVAGYLGWREHETGLRGLTTNGNWNLYGRVAPFADCSRFTPPKGTEALCADKPAGAARAGQTAEYYIFDPASPGFRFAGPAYLVSETPNAMRAFADFSRAAILHQPGDYLDAVLNDAVRLVDVDHPSSGQLTPQAFQSYLTAGLDASPTGNAFVEYWRALVYPTDAAAHGSIGAFKTYERWTRPRGPLMALVLVLAALAPFTAPRGSRRVAGLTALTAFALLLFPIASKAYDYRFVVPALGPLAAAAALGAWGLAGRVRRRRGTPACGPGRAVDLIGAEER